MNERYLFLNDANNLCTYQYTDQEIYSNVEQIIVSSNDQQNLVLNPNSATLSNSSVNFSLTLPTLEQQTDKNYYLNANGLWSKVVGGGGGGGTGTPVEQTFVGDGNTTIFTLDKNYTPGFLNAFINGLKQDPKLFTATDGSTVVFNTAPAQGNLIDISGLLVDPGYVLPIASTTTLGGVKVDGNTIKIDNTGIITASGGGGGGVDPTKPNTWTAEQTFNANIVTTGIKAGGSLGTSGQVLTSNGSGSYWSTPGGGGYVLPIASTTTLGGVKVDGSSIRIDAGGTITAPGTTNPQFIQPGTGAVSRYISDRIIETISVKDFGAIGDGNANDRTAFVNASTAGAIIVPKGRYRIDSNLTIPTHVTFQPGSSLIIPTGVTITFNNGISSGVYQIFNCIGTGKVVFNEQYQIVGYPEWWGATIGGADCSTAINACITACPITQLGVGDYYTTATIKIQKNGRTLNGVGGGFSSKWGINAGYPSNTTRIVTNSATIDIVQLGPDTNPGVGPNTGTNATTSLTLSNVSVVRTVGPNISVGPKGVLVQYTFFVNLSYVDSWDSTYGFLYKETCRTNIKNCISWRLLAGTGAGTDSFQGHVFVSNNWSSYMIDSGAGCSITPAGDTVGIGFAGEATDTFLLRPEVTACKTGIFLNLTTDTNNIDVKITDAIVDQFTSKGLYIAFPPATPGVDSSYANKCAISVMGGYFTPGAGGTVGMQIDNCYGQISLLNNQVIGWPSPGTVGLLLTNVWNLIAAGNMYKDCSGGAVVLNKCGLCRITDSSGNRQYKSSSSAILLTGSTTRCFIGCVINGWPNSWLYGVNVESGSTYNEINGTTINDNTSTTKINNLGGATNQILGT